MSALVRLSVALLLCAGCSNFLGGVNLPAGDAGGSTGSGGGAGTTSGGGAAQTTPCTPQNATVPLQRLTQHQYLNSVTDLLGLTTLPTLDLPTDEAIGPFAGNNVSPVTDLSVSQYATAAQTLARQVVSSNVTSLTGCAANAIDANCITSFVGALGKRVHRRPLTTDEQMQYVALTQQYLQAGDGPSAAGIVVEAMLQSPSFLYRFEFGTDSDSGVLTQYEIATRLAYALWDSTPDRQLLDAADAGELADTQGIALQTQRLISDPRFANNMGDFVTQWLNLQALPSQTKDPNVYPSFTPALLSAMQEEPRDFVAYVMTQDDGRLETLLTAPYSVLTDPLFLLYGVAKPANYVAGSRVALPANHRIGLLMQAAFLTAHAHGNTQPPVVLRGKVLRENLLCQAMPAPPPNIPMLPATIAPNETARQIFASHEQNPTCAACHALMDPMGLAFEHYDGIGAWRDTQNGTPIDVSGNITGTANTNEAFADSLTLANDLATSTDVQSCVVTQLFRYGMTRTETTTDSCTLSTLTTQFNANQHDLRALILAITTSPFFTARVGATP